MINREAVELAKQIYVLGGFDEVGHESLEGGFHAVDASETPGSMDKLLEIVSWTGPWVWISAIFGCELLKQFTRLGGEGEALLDGESVRADVLRRARLTCGVRGPVPRRALAAFASLTSRARYGCHSLPDGASLARDWPIQPHGSFEVTVGLGNFGGVRLGMGSGRD